MIVTEGSPRELIARYSTILVALVFTALCGMAFSAPLVAFAAAQEAAVQERRGPRSRPLP
ncbi:MAG: hypothetical protein JO281_15930 [Pseudonocardiales bacterium]|nr:hypothetical protein [Pseudonocardiales bacterium]